MNSMSSLKYPEKCFSVTYCLALSNTIVSESQEEKKSRDSM